MPEIYGFAIQVEGNAVKSITAIDEKLNLLNKSAQKTDSVFAGLFKFETLKQALNLIKIGASEVYSFGKQMEQTMLSFEVLTGSKDKAIALQKELKRLADISPMVDSAIYNGAKMLLNYGIESNKVGGYLNMLGDISAGDADRFQRLAYVFGQVSAQTRLQGGDLRQMIDAGFNPLQEMVKKTGKSYEQLKDDMAKGKISFDMVVGAMKSVTSEGGRFNNMMQRQAETVGGMESTFIGTLQSGMYGLFQRMAPGMKQFWEQSTRIAQSFATWITPRQSEILSDQRMEMSAMIEVLKKGNTPLEVRKDIINKLNTEYGTYLGKQISDKTSLQELITLQQNSNRALLDKIKITAQEEVLADVNKKLATLQKDIVYKEIAVEKAEEPGGAGTAKRAGAGRRKALLRGELIGLKEEYAEAEKESKRLQDRLNAITVYVPPVKGVQKIKPVMSDMDEIDETSRKSSRTAGAGAGAGFETSKVINMYFNQPLMQINAASLAGEDLQENGEKVIEQITRELHNIAYEQGIM